MPSHHDHLLHSLSDPQLAAMRRGGGGRHDRAIELEIAAWLHLPGVSDLPVSLLLSYRDGNRQHHIPVDHGRINPHQRILLSGVARLPLQQLEAVELRLRSAIVPQRIRVEDIFIQPIDTLLP